MYNCMFLRRNVVVDWLMANYIYAMAKNKANIFLPWNVFLESRYKVNLYEIRTSTKYKKRLQGVKRVMRDGKLF